METNVKNYDYSFNIKKVREVEKCEANEKNEKSSVEVPQGDTKKLREKLKRKKLKS